MKSDNENSAIVLDGTNTAGMMHNEDSSSAGVKKVWLINENSGNTRMMSEMGIAGMSSNEGNSPAPEKDTINAAIKSY